jgi:Fe-Mn family superoxide dismutase
MRYKLKQIHCRPWTLSVVVYCAYGFHVGCKTAIKLREAGFDARYMNSGHSGWKAIGAPIWTA